LMLRRTVRLSSHTGIFNMLTIKRKNKKITLDFFTDDYVVYEYFKIEKTSKTKPRWMTKDLPINGCAGFNDFFNKSFLIKSWADIVLDKEKKSDIMYEDTVSEDNITVESPYPSFNHGSNLISDRGSFLPKEKYQHVKIRPPWVAYASNSIPCAFYGASWHSDIYMNEMQYLPAIRDLYYSPNFNLHYILNKDLINETFYIDAGAPMQYFIPLSEKRIEVENHYDPYMVKKMRDFYPQKFFARNKVYYNLRKLIKNTKGE